jgi:luciferase family oxidoreductase group 1
LEECRERSDWRLLNPLKLSVLDLVPIFEDAEPITALQQSVRLAQTAENLGYTRYWVTEHHDMEKLASAAPEVLLAHIGAVTRHIRIGSGAVLLPHYKPIKVAEVFHLLATLYPGRIDLGVGRAPGGSAEVVTALNDNFLEQIRRMPESLQALSELLTHQYQVENKTVIARPIPPEAPELWLLGTNKKSANYAAQFGAGYAFGQFMSDQDALEMLTAYRQAFQPSMLGQASKVIVAVGAVCAETEDEARRLAKAGGLLFNPDGSNEAEDQTMQSNRILIGDPQQMKEQLLRLQKRFDADEFMIVTMTADYEARIRSYEYIADMMLGER